MPAEPTPPRAHIAPHGAGDDLAGLAGKILYVIHHRQFSGAETLHVPLLRRDSEALVACPPDSPSESLASSAGASTLALRFRELRHSGGALETARSVLRGLAGAVELRRILRRHRERRIVYCIALRPAMLASLAAVGLRRRVIWYVPDFFPPWPVRAIALVLCRLTAAHVIAISECVADDAAARGSRLRGKMTVVHPGLEPTGTGLAAAGAGSPRAAVVGHISPTKRTGLALDIAAAVARDVPEFRLDIIGRAQYRDEDFEYERRLEARVREQPLLAPRVAFSGYSEDVAKALAGAGLLLHCRADEPFGMVLLEAMRAGLPVVAPRAGGPVEIVDDGVTGFLYTPDDTAEAARLVTTLIRDRELAARMGAAGRRRVEERFAARRQTGLILEVMARAVRASPPAA